MERYARLVTAAARFRDRLGGRTVWNVNSTAVGGGVAEMLQVLVGYSAGLDIAVRWTVIGGDPEFFAITKKLHNQMHGAGQRRAAERRRRRPLRAGPCRERGRAAQAGPPGRYRAAA